MIAEFSSFLASVGIDSKLTSPQLPCTWQVERVSHPLLQQQYQLHRERLMQSCQQRPVEQVLYHGTSESAVPDICTHGFNRSFCGRNGKACEGQGHGPC